MWQVRPFTLRSMLFGGRRGTVGHIVLPDMMPSANLATNSFPNAADDGVLHVVAQRNSIQEAVAQLDLNRARLLARLSQFWVRRSRDLSTSLRELLGAASCNQRCHSPALLPQDQIPCRSPCDEQSLCLCRAAWRRADPCAPPALPVLGGGGDALLAADPLVCMGHVHVHSRYGDRS